MMTLLIVLALLAVCFFGKNWLIDCLMQAAYCLARCWFRAWRITQQVGDIRWCYLEAGNKDKPTMLLIHGFGVDKYNWLPYVPQLANDFHIIVPDLPGFGETALGASVTDFTIDEQLERLERFVEALGIKSFHIAGNSMGGLISGLYSAAHPEAVKSLVLMDSVGLDCEQDKTSFLFTAFDQGEFKLVPKNVEEAQNLLNNVGAKPMKVPTFILSYILRKQEQHRQQLEAIFTLVIDYQRNTLLAKSLAQLTMPVLVMWGKEDKLLNVAGGENAMKYLVNGTLALLDDVGHAPMAESPKVAAKHHKQFIRDNCA